jgi:hypothetical protein
MQARLRITVGTKAGTAITPVVSGRFGISGSAAAGPEILNAAVNGKQLLISGQRVSDGASLFMCDSCAAPASQGSVVKKTGNDSDNPSTLLVARKAGKSISAGQTVILQVKNADGSVSNAFSFTR